MAVVLDRLVEVWNRKEQARDGLVPDAFADADNQRRLRTASWVRGLLALVVVGLAVVLFVGPDLSTPVLAALLGGLGLVTLGLVVVAVRSLAVLAAIERAAEDPAGSASLVGAGDEGAELGERVDLEDQHGVQADDAE